MFVLISYPLRPSKYKEAPERHCTLVLPISIVPQKLSRRQREKSTEIRCWNIYLCKLKVLHSQKTMKYLIFFTALITTANALVCQCNPCTEATCRDAENCYSSDTEIFTGKDTTGKATIKGCQSNTVEKDICTRGFVIMSSESDFYLMNNVTCCKSGDSCNKNITAPLNKNIPNSKLVCPSCFAKATTCEPKIMKCNDLQKKCFNITGKITKGTTPAQDFTARGCAVENNIFKNGSSLVSGDTTYALEIVTFQDAKSGASQISSCLSFAILLPSVLWLLLDRSLY
ncbi:PREDICTED: phospholipase A2 inhibitor and Ly6/PLAUR domain-containing protein-like [Thamnophis sirtalis]|uniref:Phospholipase A2 inhibitor and Ly6/PLAUR domain-containing protein-like n=1 Tax=Thamnophis sirtalis TaxID=35019 RepID=A0A6I9XXF5_9SAUR|nr:PREDICTED: phospholipase A2 inhibitor and Ly6/PLAUR domain-containing protein-like [Thamnophis sirtalis]